MRRAKWLKGVLRQVEINDEKITVLYAGYG